MPNRVFPRNKSGGRYSRVQASTVVAFGRSALLARCSGCARSADPRSETTTSKRTLSEAAEFKFQLSNVVYLKLTPPRSVSHGVR